MGERIKKQYHWVIAVVAFLQLFLLGGLNNNLSSIFVIPVTEALEISRGSFSLAMSMKSLVSFLCSMISGIVLRKIGFKRSVCVLFMVSAVAMTIMSTSQSVVTLAVGAAMHGLSESACNTAGVTFLIGKWFHKHRGTVLGLVTAATGLGGSVLCLVLTGVMEKGGFRSAYLCAAVLFVALCVLILLLVRETPEKMGRKAYGAGEVNLGNKKLSSEYWLGFSFQELLRKPTFYLMLVGTFLSCCFIYFPYQVLVPHLQGCGLSLQEATLCQSIYLVTLAIMKFLMGALSDRIGARKVTMICMAASVACLVIMTMVDSFGMALVGVILLATGLPMTALTIPLLGMSLFGYRAQTSYVGVFISMSCLAGMASGPVVNSAFDRLGSYIPTFWVAAAGIVLLMGLFLVMYALADRDKKKFLAENP